MLWPLYCILCTLQFIGYKTKDWGAVSDRIIARLRARCENIVGHCDCMQSEQSFTYSSFGASAERLRWGCDRPVQQATPATCRARTTRPKACSPTADLVAGKAMQDFSRTWHPQRGARMY